MKIYKPSFEDFLEEVTEPVYLLIHTVPNDSKIVQGIAVSATGFNKENRPIHYITMVGESFNHDHATYEKAEEVQSDMRRQIALQNMCYTTGIVNDSPILGDTYEISEQKEKIDISQACSQDPEGNEILAEEIAANKEPKS